MKIKNNVLLEVTEKDVDENGYFQIPDGITISKSVTTIENYAFLGCQLLGN